MPAVPTVLPSRSAAEPIPPSGSEISEVSGDPTTAPTASTSRPLLRGEQHLGLVRDRQVRPSGGDLLDRRGGIGGHLRLDVEARLPEEAPVDRGVDPGVVGVHVPVEVERERLWVAGRAGRRVAVPAAGGQAQREHRRAPRAPPPGARVAIAVSCPCHPAAIPGDDLALDQRDQREEDDRHHREQRDGGEHPGGQQAAGRDQDLVAEAGARARPTRRRPPRSPRRRSRSWCR